MKKRTKMLLILSVVLLSLILPGFYNALKVVRYDIPAGGISHPIRIALVTDLHSCAYGDGQRELADAIGKELGRDGYDMYKPAALVIPSNLRDSKFGKEDDACALQNIFLAAYSYGVGSVWINQLNGICDHAPVRAMLTKLGIPEDHVVYGMAALGYADPEAPKGEFRRAGEVSFVK